MEKLVALLETINADDLSFMYKNECIRVYNLLMAVVVNDSQKSPKVCQMLGQGFNRLMRGQMDDFFGELGIPAEWYESNIASTLTPSTFDEQRLQFVDSDVSYKWQWFTDLSYDYSINDSEA